MSVRMQSSRLTVRLAAFAVALAMCAADSLADSVIRSIAYDGSGIDTSRGDLFLPDAVDADTPVVLVIHGGGWSSMCRGDLEGIAAFFRDDLGFAAFNIDCRFASAMNRWSACGDDCVQAAKYLLSPAFGNVAGLVPKKIWICGASAGGHLALCTAHSLPPAKVAGVVAISPVGDPLMDPRRLVDGAGPPILMTHATKDQVVPLGRIASFVQNWLPASADGLADGFRIVPASNRPWCYWWWLNGHVDRETITADLEAMKRLGFGGVLMFDSRGYWEDDNHLRMAKPEIGWGTDEWNDFVAFSIRECSRLGLEFTMNASASGGVLNGFAGGKEYEVDVLDREKVVSHLDRVLGPILKRVPDLVGRTFTHIYSVSYEGSVRKGGDCRDIRKSLYAAMREWAHEHGLKVFSESGGPWSRKPDRFAGCDQLAFYAENDMPQGEFWYRLAGEPSPLPFVRGAASAAHVFGRPRVSAEAFTHMMQHWSAVPCGLKRCGDDAFVDGANHFVWHTFTCSPKRFGVPGHEYFAGTHINRNVTWHGEAAAFVRYLGRCQWMLQQGVPVSDFAIWAGSAPYQGWGRHRGRPYDESSLALPRTASYDLVDTLALLEHASGSDGKVVFPGGAECSALLLDPADRAEFTEEVGKKVAKLREQGVLVAWSGEAPEVFGRVKLDFEAPSPFLAIHRRTEREDVYFVTGEGSCEAAFRTRRNAAEIWNPTTGSRRRIAATRVSGEHCKVRFDLPRCGSAFVVFREGSNLPEATEKGARDFLSIDGPWLATFSYHPGINARPPAPRNLALGDFSKDGDFDVAHFAGTVLYRTEFLWKSGDARPEAISLGDVVGGVVRVVLNGSDLGVLWTAPWEVRIPDALLVNGENALELRFVNAWANRLIGDCKLEPESRVTTSNLAYRKGIRKEGVPPECSGYVSGEELFPCGVCGPVRLLFSPKERNYMAAAKIWYNSPQF